MSRPKAKTMLRVLITLSLILYLFFVIEELTYQFDITIILLYIVFLIGYFYIWRSEILAGIIFVVWYGLLWCLALWFWVDGGMTLIIGFPIPIIGIGFIIQGIRSRVSKARQPEKDEL